MGYNHIKHRYYACIIYNENNTEHEMLQVLKDSKIPCIVSPLHCDDVWTETDVLRIKDDRPELFDDSYHIPGGKKKSHWHVIFEMPYSKQPKSSLAYLNDNLPKSYHLNYIEGVGVLSIYCRYLCHLDDPSKAQYPKEQCHILNNMFVDFSKPSPPKTQRNLLNDLTFFIANNNTNITRLINVYREDDEMLKFIVKNTYFVKILIQENWG